ncbi:MAG: type II toxin-antitoxin system HigB family toxin [Magnetococcales bacterium]|nr:type II toxin-antitoxin system HigB family toxin [Magnetococcales bacterium]MBF0149656.1 type II toxin-antitoxin system HigB family toxin [Magnetococcales bacterium]MBF0172502.1 type II toxin-antitoxin system HigB family toxin [Magnetococcales bacterium]MBF0348532.1 type II toxin-antitoxin system HigB family toxin [Magnetococcales bacterium]MBF0631799.1 type II toxin-antitoxin system HigB family toxin [Magnetococcales bacterium]
MRIIAKRTLREFWERVPACLDCKGPLEAWYALAAQADWKTPSEVKSQFRHASLLKGNRVVFNIAGNKYRLVVKVNYSYGVAYIRFVGTHAQYDQINAETV